MASQWQIKKAVVIGTGYVGLPTAIMLARAGLQVVGVDINENVVGAINEGVLHIREEQLQALMHEPGVRHNLIALNTPCLADVFIIAVPTPLDHRKKAADLHHVIEATESILPYLQAGNLVILESTVPPLTCRNLLTPLLERSGLKVGRDIFLAHCPERILPGDVFYEIIHNDRIIGGTTPEASERARMLYTHFVEGELLITDDVTAELVKLMENAHRDVNIALANEFAAVAETLEVDPMRAISLANRHPRVSILRPGIGVGGHCVPIDPWFIKEVDPTNSRLIFTARQTNDEQPYRIAARIRRAVSNIRDPNIIAIGATYKPNVCDLRESPALKIVELLREDGYRVRHYDPLVPEMGFDSMVEICRGADCLVLLVEHDVVKQELANQYDAICHAIRHPLILRFYADPI